MKEKAGVIYRFFRRDNMSKSYIGKTIHPEKRIRKHLNGKTDSSALQRAIKKYGKEAFVVEILEKDIPESQLSKMEILYIRFFNSKAPNGYNLTDGGEGISGYMVTPEARRLISEANKGKTFPPEHRRNLSKAAQGRIPWHKGKRGVYSEETLKKMSEARKGKPGPNKGKQRSAEVGRKISEAKKGKPSPLKGRTLPPATRRKISEAQTGRSSPNKGKPRSAETRQKISEKNKGTNPWHKGKQGVYSEETLRKMSEARKGTTHSADTLRKMSEAHRRPEYNEARVYYFLAFPPDMPVKEKRKHLLEQFPGISYGTIYGWIRGWASEGV